MGSVEKGTTWGKSAAKTKGLTDKQWIFVQEYTTCWDAKKSAEKAGYKNPAVVGRALLSGKRFPAVTKEIKKVQEAVAKKFKLDREMILEELSVLSMRDVLDLCNEDGDLIVSDFRSLPPEIRRCIDGIDVDTSYDPETGEIRSQKFKIKLVGKLSAFDMINKMIGAYAPEKSEVKMAHSLDWDALYEEGEDPIQEAIDAVGKSIEEIE